MSSSSKNKRLQRIRRAIRVRARMHGTATKPRLTVFRSSRHISAQLINDDLGRTLAAATDLEIKSAKGDKPLIIAGKVGQLLAEKTATAGVKEVVFDRGAYRYHGRVAALAAAARDHGLDF